MSVKRPGSSGCGTTVRDTARYDGILFDELPLNIIGCAPVCDGGRQRAWTRDLNPPRVIASRGQGFKSLQLLRQVHAWYCRVVLTIPDAEMPRRDPPRTGEHGAASHLLQLDNVLIPGHEPHH